MNFKFIFIATILFSQSLLAGEFKLSSNSKDQVVNAILKEIEDELPVEMKNTINTQVTLKFTNLNKKNLSAIDDNCSEKIILGRDLMISTNTQIEIDNVFIKEVQRERNINCNHKTIRTYFKATVVHELAHMYDQKKNISKNPLFLNITGWISKGLFIKKRTNLNQLSERSPDRYEYKSNLETFAVNFEHFLYDSSYKCRRPTYYEFYANLFGTKDQMDECVPNKKISITVQSGKNSQSTLLRDMNFERLYEVHYLFAGKGEEAMSRFGHAMYRLVFCAPGKEKGPACMNDTAYHVILSFRANIQEMTMDYNKGIQGEYPSQLFFLTLPEVIDEYTKGEFREVTSLPLKLNNDQLKRFLLRSSELYWSYQGKYYFFTNNCATEAMNILRVALGEQNDAQTKNITTPIGLFEYLIKSKLGDTSILKDKNDAQLKGYYYPGVTNKILSSMKILGITETNFEKFALKFKASERMKIYQRAIESGTNMTMTAANALRVEDLILHSQEIKFAKEMGARLFGNDPDPRLKETALGQRVMELRDLYAELSPMNFLTPGYGIPLQHEFVSVPKEKISEVTEKVKTYTDDLQSICAEFFPVEIAELKGTMQNRLDILAVISKS